MKEKEIPFYEEKEIETDQQLGKYDIEVMNGDGYYDSEGNFIRTPDPDSWWAAY